MARGDDPKAARLRESRSLHRAPERVRDSLFLTHPEFFDRRDLLQVRYEMVRRVQIDRSSVAQAARDFGVTRPTIYAAQRRFRSAGLQGLLGTKSGPKGSWKLRPEILDHLVELQAKEGRLPYRELARRVEEAFGKTIDSSTIFRALQARGKKRRSTGRPPRRSSPRRR